MRLATPKGCTPDRSNLSLTTWPAPHDSGCCTFSWGILRPRNNNSRPSWRAEEDHAAALAGLADIANERSDYATAAKLYTRALDIDPAASQLNYRLGMVYRKLGDVDRARAALAMRGERIPFIEDPLLVVMQAHVHPPQYYMSQAEDALAKDDLRQAARLYSLALLVAPTHAPALVQLGEVLLAVNQNDAARQRFEQLVAAHPDMAIGHYYLGLCAARAGQRESAITHMREALALDPQMERATRALRN